MSRYALAHLADSTLTRDLAAAFTGEDSATALLLAHISEFDARRLYLPAGYPSMFAYCVGALGRSEDAVAKRIQAARAARRFPVILEAVADGRLHLSGVCLLAPHLTEETAAELLAAATHRSKAGIQRLLAERFPRPDVLAWVESMPGSAGRSAPGEHAPGHVENGSDPGSGPAPAAPEPRVPEHAPGHARDGVRVRALSPGRVAVQFSMSEQAYERLRYAQALLEHPGGTGDLGAVYERAIEALIARLERQKFAATTRPRPGHRRQAADSRHIPADVKRAVRERDQGRCTFVGENGHRCEARAGLQFDHVEAYARGGEATVSGIRLLCRAHNQFEAERTYGPEFMRNKRRAAAETRAAAKARAAAEGTPADERVAAAESARDQDVVPWLRALGFSVAEARRAAERCDAIPDAPLEERVRVALSSFRVRGARPVPGVQRLERTSSRASAEQAQPAHPAQGLAGAGG